MDVQNLVASAIQTANGWVAVCWEGEVVRRVSIGNASPAVALRSLEIASALIDPHALTVQQRRLVERLAAAAVGSNDDFRDVSIDLSHLGTFARRVAERCRKIPPGKTMTYGQLAAACGSPHAARAVGNVMRTNRVPLIVPCHRVVGHNNALGGFSAPQGVQLKQKMLAGEQSAVAAS
jgi:methylated-DNA-[protein]-cysteine S-methyltransferase